MDSLITLDTFITIITSLGIGGVIGYIVKYNLDKLSEIKRKVRESREIQYKDLLSNLLGFFTGWENPAQQKQFMRELYVNAPLYASDKVIKLGHKFLRKHADKKVTSDETDKIYAEIVIEVRRELNAIQGEPVTELKTTDIKLFKLDED